MREEREARREQLRAIVLHELAHLRARDIPLHWLHTLACAAHWFNPLAHIGARAWMRFREEAADECAIAWLGRRDATAATEYGEAFVEALKHSRTFSLPLGALAVGESNKNLKQRMIMILNHAQKTPCVALALALTIGLAAATAFLPMRAAAPQPAATKAASAQPKAGATNPDDVLLKNGIALRELGRDAEARAAFEEAIAINPKNAPCLNNLGNYEFLAGRYAESKKYYQRAIDADPEFAEAWYDLGNAIVALGQSSGGATFEAAMREAEQHYRHALKLDPDLTLAADNLGRLLRAMNRPDEAAVYLKKINEGKNSRQAEAGGVGTAKADSSTAPRQNDIFVGGTIAISSDISDIGHLFDLKDLDQIPQEKGIRAKPVYPSEMKRQGISGAVTVFFIVDANGDVRGATVTKSTNPEFETPAIEAVRQWKFRPGRKDGKIVATALQIPIAFNLGDKAPDPQPDGAKTGSSSEVTVPMPPPIVDQPDSSTVKVPADYFGGPVLKSLGQIFDLKDLDSPPMERGIRATPVYPAEMKRQGISGKVTLSFIIDDNGHTRDITVHDSTNREFETPAIQAVQQWKFRPGRKDGKAVATRLQIPIAFNLRDKD